jgi:transcriptional regulator with PAS, ATPase and Fis domain
MQASRKSKKTSLSTASGTLRMVRSGSSPQVKDIFEGQPSEHAQSMRAEIARVASRPHNILITGETGTGKTLMARQIHRCSARADNPFIELNCANLPEHLVEAELFGYRKGAFTGADHDRKGLFEEADGGILFLDEIGDIRPSVQNRLLKVIDEKQMKRLGMNRYISCDVQIIGATSRNLPAMMRSGEFRQDLYCRLAVLTVETIPLRSRREDIPAMVALFMREASKANIEGNDGWSSYCIDQDALSLLCEFDYLGNIRALRNLIFELTSYLEENQSVSRQLVQFVLTKMRSQGSDFVCDGRLPLADGPSVYCDDHCANQPSLESHLKLIARDGDIILPLDLCVLRQGETFKQWSARAKQCSIEAVRHATGGTLRSAAERLSLSRSSLKNHLHRAKRTKEEALFD